MRIVLPPPDGVRDGVAVIFVPKHVSGHVHGRFSDAALRYPIAAHPFSSQTTPTAICVRRRFHDINPSMSTSAAASTGPNLSEESTRAVSRYQDAYRTAKAINGLGQLCKVVGVFVGIVMIFFAVLGSQTVMRPNPSLAGVVNYQAQGNLYLISAIFFGAVIAFIGWVIGVLVSGYGQHLKAALDEAVNTSPFLSDAQRAQLMKLS